MFASSLTHTHATSIYLLSLHDALPISRDALQTQIAGLETGNDDTGYAYTFSSGLAAETALLMATCVPGDRVVVGNDVYGGTYRLLDKVLGPWKLEHHVVDMSNLDRKSTRLNSSHVA